MQGNSSSSKGVNLFNTFVELSCAVAVWMRSLQNTLALTALCTMAVLALAHPEGCPCYTSLSKEQWMWRSVPPPSENSTLTDTVT